MYVDQAEWVATVDDLAKYKAEAERYKLERDTAVDMMAEWMNFVLDHADDELLSVIDKGMKND